MMQSFLAKNISGYRAMSVRAAFCILAAVAGAAGAETPAKNNHETAVVVADGAITSVDSARGTFKAKTDSKIENFYVTTATKFEKGTTINNLKDLVGVRVSISYHLDEKTGAGKVLEVVVVRISEIPPPNPIQVPGRGRSS